MNVDKAKEMKGKKCDQDRDFSRVLTASSY